MGSGKVFDHLIEDLTSFCNPITIDLAGHGKTKSPDDPKFYSTKRQVEQLESIIHRLQFDNLYLYGYSMGGRLAFQMIASHPELFSGAIIESSHCGILSEEERSERQILDENRAKGIQQNFDDFLQKWMKLPLFQHTPAGMKSVYQRIMRAQDPKTISASLRGFGPGVMPPVCNQIKNTDLPLTLIAGKLDQKYVQRMSEISDVHDQTSLHIIEDAGHRVHADQPEKLIQILSDAIKS